MATIKELKSIVSQVRRDIVRQVNLAGTGHPGGSLGCADFMVALYFELMERKEGFDMKGEGEDLFFLSNGHISPVFYSVLARAGYFDADELALFRKINSRLQGHPTSYVPGVRIASGSLGQGVSVAIGAALGKKQNGDDKLVYCLTGDGELQEGQIWEALMFAPHHIVDNLIVTVDWNGQQIDGPTSEVMANGDLRKKFKAFGWEVLVLNQGNNMARVVNTLKKAKEKTGQGKPVVVLMKTMMGYGVDYMMHTHKWHGKAPNDEQTEAALAQLKETIGDFVV